MRIVNEKISNKVHKQLRGQLHKQLIKEPGLHYEVWGPIREQVPVPVWYEVQIQVSNQLKQNISL